MPNLERTLVRQFEMPNETDRAALDRMCSSYGFVASKFLFAFQTRELRREVKDFRAFRNRLVTALSRKSVEFSTKQASELPRSSERFVGALIWKIRAQFFSEKNAFCTFNYRCDVR